MYSFYLLHEIHCLDIVAAEEKRSSSQDTESLNYVLNVTKIDVKP